MLKYLYPSVDWRLIKVVGFDLDGTLYDEAEFITQAYLDVAKILSAITKTDLDETYSSIYSEWLIRGSSYNQIFRDYMDLHHVNSLACTSTEKQCISEFRASNPILYMPVRAKFILNYIAKYYPIFLITDGSVQLQRAKLRALDLERIFKSENIAITGGINGASAKPSIASLESIAALVGVDPASVVYFGDRDIDRNFAMNAGFHFVKVASMLSMNEV